MGDYTPIYTPGQTISGTLSTAIVGGNLVAVSATGTIGVAGANSIAVVGVAAQDAASGARVAYYTGGVQELVTSGTVTAGDQVVAAAAGLVSTLAGVTTPTAADVTNTRAIIGIALTTATTGNKVRVQMNR